MSSTVLGDTERSSAERSDSRSESLRTFLRNGTRQAHEALDRRFEAMMAAETPTVYGRFIAMNEACHAALEPLVAASALGSAMPDVLATRLGPALTHDREALGLPRAETPAFAIRDADTAQAAGILYVLEGSRLGARYLHRAFREARLEERWGVSPSAYLAGAAEGDFRALTQELHDLVGARDEFPRALAAANDTFGFFSAVLDGLEANANSTSEKARAS